ncbi:MAG TPA: 2-oxoacid:acceptor oxidoreductase subunit alpha [Acidobacteriota bacterium]|nr:2-oxoacid:acceptor oxidoreductase subunit alpha [Acidobacteriota bacterium]
MDTAQIRAEERIPGETSKREVVNDFSIEVATVNGSGSQSSNNVLMRSIFRMGVPVSGKNLFPSNIAGLPTWFTIRASKEGHVGRKKEIDLLIAMNPETASEDVMNLEAGRAVIYEEKLNLSRLREDLIYYPVPFNALAGEIVSDVRLRKLIANMVYVGTAAELLSIEMQEVERAIADWFKAKKKAIELNIRAAHLGAEFAREKLRKADPCRVERMDATSGKIIIDGNSAAALGCVFAGVTVVTWYPITPSSSLGEALSEYLGRFRIDKKTGKATFAVVQAEDELAAVGMAIGAGWAGARAMTTTSGPGISLMGEFAGLAYFAEIPCVIFDVQRVGPSTGLPTRTSQADITSLYFLSHGDTRHVVLIPADMKECFEMAITAFDLSEHLQQPVFVASDLDLGMNNWMADPFEYPSRPLQRGKVLNAEDLERLGEFARYKDLDGDGIPYRTLPGTDHPLAAYFTRGSGHDEKARYSERPEDYTNLMDRLARKHETARKLVPQPIVRYAKGAEIGILAYGSSDPAILESLDQMSREYGIEAHYLRLRALPLSESVHEFIRRCRRVYVVEQNRDGQMADLIKIDADVDAAKLRKILHFTGLPLDARFVTDRIIDFEQNPGK